MILRFELGKVDPKAFQAGNLTGVGKSSRAFQTIKSKLKGERSSLKGIHENLLQASEKISKDDELSALSLGHYHRRFFGYVHNFPVTNAELKVVLLDEAMVRLYHERCKKDPLYIDATGTVVEDIKEYKRILYYCVAVRNPLGGTPPLPVVEYITSNHTVTSIRSPLISLRAKEKDLFGFNISPPLIISDFSYALIIPCLMEFCREDVREYLNRTYRTVMATQVDFSK